MRKTGLLGAQRQGLGVQGVRGAVAITIATPAPRTQTVATLRTPATEMRVQRETRLQDK
jgi:hypothetical protein